MCPEKAPESLTSQIAHSEGAASESPFQAELSAHIKQTIHDIAQRPGDYAGYAAGLGALALAASPWGRQAGKAVLEQIASATKESGAIDGALKDVTRVITRQLFEPITKRHAGDWEAAGAALEAAAAKLPGLTPAQMVERSGLETLLRGDQKAPPANIYGAFKLMAQDAALNQRPELSPTEATKLVESLGAYPSEFDVRMYIANGTDPSASMRIATAQDRILRMTNLIDTHPDSLIATRALSERAKAYGDGHFDGLLVQTRRDLDRAIALAGDEPDLFYQRGRLWATDTKTRLAREEDLKTARQLVASHAAIEHGVEPSQAINYVHDVKAYPVDELHARTIPDTEKAMTEIVRLSRQLDGLPAQSEETAATLTARSAWYKQLGHRGAAAEDQAHAGAMETRMKTADLITPERAMLLQGGDGATKESGAIERTLKDGTAVVDNSRLFAPIAKREAGDWEAAGPALEVAAAKLPGLTPAQMVARSGLEILLAEGQKAPSANIYGAIKLMAQDAALSQRPELSPTKATKLVESLGAYVSESDVRLHIADGADPSAAMKIATAQDRILRMTNLIDAHPDSLIAVRALSERAKAYGDSLFDRILVHRTDDLNRAITLVSNEPELFYQRGGLWPSDWATRMEREADRKTAHQLVASRAAVEHGIEPSQAIKYVQDVRAYPVDEDRARTIPETERAMTEIVRLSRQIDALPAQSEQTATALTARSQWYKQLGHHDASARDRAHAGAMETRMKTADLITHEGAMPLQAAAGM